MICVPVLADNGQHADLSALKEVSIAISRGLKKGDVVALNPSVPPGTTQEIILPLIEKEASGLKAESDFYLIYNPERIYEGRAIQDIEDRYPAIVSGAGPKSLEVGVKLYSIVFKKGVITVTNIKTAETEKLFEGVYRDVNCSITRLGRIINDSMPAYTVQQAIKLLNRGKSITQSIVTLLGLAFRGGVSDTRLSPTYRVIEELKKLKVREIRIHDPLVKNDPFLSKEENIIIILTSNLTKALKDTDLIMLIADHPEYRVLTSKEIKESPIYDGRGLLDRSKFNLSDLAVIGLG
jgi:UDP-N-acetyl-D-mannosaminuronate dehydrogenase